MKGKLFAAVAAALFSGSAALAAEPADLIFTQKPNGKYIYCNNHERIRCSDLADNGNENAKLLMNNDGLTADRYSAFISFLNQTNLDGNDKPSGRGGFDIEVDVLFRARENTVITIERLGFEVPEHRQIFLNGTRYAAEDEWGCFDCWSDYLGLPIEQINSGCVYEPRYFEPKTITLKAGETAWLSRYIENYREIPLARSVNIMTDFVIESGVCDADIAALRCGAAVGDRSGFNENAAYGSYVRDKQYKGISDGTNEVEATLEYTIDDSEPAQKLPVTVYNRYMPEGNTITDWYTHLNPNADEWSYDLCAQSDMLSFKYYDPYKKYLYGSAVPESERDDYYVFDTEHLDTSVYNKAYGGKSGYIPNREYKDGDPRDYACNLANYGVIYNYNVRITNNGNKRRYLIYRPATSSNNLVYVKDSRGNVLDGRVLSKGTSSIRLSDDMTCLPLAAQSVSEYTICVVLTPNYPGGIQNALCLSDYPSLIETYETRRGGLEKDKYFDGREYYSWDGGGLSLSADGVTYSRAALPKSVLDDISGSLREYELTWTGGGYVLRPRLYDAGWYEDIKNTYRNMYLLDENLNLIRKQTFGSYPQGFACANGVYYVKMADSVFRSTTEFRWWDMTDLDLPCWNYGRFSAMTRGGKIYLSQNGLDFDEVVYTSFKPEYVDARGELYFYADGRTLWLSKDALNWKPVTFGGAVKSFSTDGGRVIAGGEARDLPRFSDTAAFRIDGKYVALEHEILIEGGRAYIPLRAAAEYLGCVVTWRDGEAAVEAGGKTAVIREPLITNDLCRVTPEQLSEVTGRKFVFDGAAVTG